MWKKFLGVVLVLVAGAGILLADEAKGTVKKYDKGTITVTVDGKDVDYMLKGAKVYDDSGTEVTDKKDRRKLLTDLKEGTKVTIVYEKDGDKITVKEFKVKK
jgi:Cu/Ag efflux protein CusF